MIRRINWTGYLAVRKKKNKKQTMYEITKRKKNTAGG